MEIQNLYKENQEHAHNQSTQETTGKCTFHSTTKPLLASLVCAEIMHIKREIDGLKTKIRILLLEYLEGDNVLW